MGTKSRKNGSPRLPKGKITSGTAPNIRKGKIVEAVVAIMHDQPGLRIETNVKLSPRLGEQARKREIDVLITGNVAGYPVRLAFSCKNERLPIKPSLIDEFFGMLDDVGIPPEHGIFVCVNGYTSGALSRAKDKGIKTLMLKGLTKDRLASEIAKAFQFTIYLLPDVIRVTIFNNLEPATVCDGRSLVFCNDKHELLGTVLDLIVDQWRKGDPPLVIGEHQLNLEIPKGWHQFVDGAPVEVFQVSCTLNVLGLVIESSGNTKQHSLVDPVRYVIERSRIDVSFDAPESGRSLPVKVFTSEQKLKEFLRRRSGVRVASRIPLPRIRCGDFYWPLSERVGKVVVEASKDGTPRHALAEIEGTDLSTVWEKPWEGVFKLGSPVLATDADGNLVDVRLLMEAEDFAAVVALQSQFEEYPTEQFAHLLAWAYKLQGQALTERAELCGDDKRTRLIQLAVERFRFAIRIKPAFTEAYKALGMALGDIREFEEAVRAYDSALALNPTDIEAWADRSAPLINQNRLDEAIDSATRAVEHATVAHWRAYALQNRATAYHFAGQAKEAVTDLVSAWKLHPPTVLESIGMQQLYEAICLAGSSVEAILLLAELRWTKAAYYAANNAEGDSDKWNELAGTTLESLIPQADPSEALSGTLSDQLIDAVLIRTAARFRSDRERQIVLVQRMQNWLKHVRGEELEALSFNDGLGTDHFRQV
jgi:tetratricopeptide (TPR) repeat protein